MYGVLLEETRVDRREANDDDHSRTLPWARAETRLPGIGFPTCML
jgi:hypothetical protein